MRCGLIDENRPIERPGGRNACHYAEILRLKGWMLSLKGDLEGAEQNFLASLDWARRQQAKSWELRTSTSLARLWLGQGKRQEAYELLAPVYGWFTEGFDTRELLEAKALLAELEPAPRDMKPWSEEVHSQAENDLDRPHDRPHPLRP